MIPWQIYADYLEDKGIDVKLFRLIEPKIKLDYNCFHDKHYGLGCGATIYGYSNGDGRGEGIGYYNYGDGWGYGNNFGSNVDRMWNGWG